MSASAASLYLNGRMIRVCLLGFASGLPLALTFSTLSAWLAHDGISRSAIGLFAMVGTPYALKFLWAPLLDAVAPPLPLGQRRGWGITIQLALMVAIAGLGWVGHDAGLLVMGLLALLVAFLSASQDIVIDAWRVESLSAEQQGAGVAATMVGYRLAMVTSGAGALLLADRVGFWSAYALMAVLLGGGVIGLLISPEPQTERRSAGAVQQHQAGAGRHRVQQLLNWLRVVVWPPYQALLRRRRWPLIVLFVIGYKLGEAMAGAMANPLYIALGYSLSDIGTVSKSFGVLPLLGGSLLGGWLAGRLPLRRVLLLCGLLQASGNLFYVLQAGSAPDWPVLALCVFAENLTGGMAGAALVAYLSSLCDRGYTASHYAALSALASLGRTVFAAPAGKLADLLGWQGFFLFTSLLALPALALLFWLGDSVPGPAADEA